MVVIKQPLARWRTWDEPDRDVTVAQWVERGICVVFPRLWAQKHGQESMIAHARDRIAAVEGVAAGNAGVEQKRLEAGSVLLAFTRHLGTIPAAVGADAMRQHLTARPAVETIDPDVSRNLLSADIDHPLVDHP